MNDTKTILKLNDGTEITIEAGTLQNLCTMCASRAEAESLQKKFTNETLKHVEIIYEAGEGNAVNTEGETAAETENTVSKRVVTGIYENMIGETTLASEDNSDGTVTLKISLREKDKTEARLESLEESTELLTAAMLA